ncbi:MAG: hypothetical protein QOG37_234, partial [Mycobacterium sp.]|nr:hypothetical protein [Mycobacterium sp.]
MRGKAEQQANTTRPRERLASWVTLARWCCSAMA